MKNILTIGAYERDNFGDALFFLLFKMALKNKNYNIIPGSIMGSDMSKYIGEYVFPYDFLLKQYKWDAVCILGGEIGGVDINLALRMSIPFENFIIFEKLDKNNKKKVIRYWVGELEDQLAYLPNIFNYEKNKNTKLIINSIGGFSPEFLVGETTLFEKTVLSLKESKIISVRDEDTYNFFNSLGIKNNIAPDVIHSLPFYYKPQIVTDNYFLFQANETFIEDNGVEKISKILNEISNKYNWKIYLFVAGTASGHDSVEKYLEIQNILIKNFKKEVLIIKESNSLKLVDWIASSKMWIGTSLHGRILSASFGVRRIGLVNKKLSNYCGFWDREFPFNIKVESLIEESEKAMVFDENFLKSKALDLSEKSKNNFIKIINNI